MGNSRFDSGAWKSYVDTNVTGRSTASIYTSRSIDADLNPKNFKIRESRDSDNNPNSNAIIIGADVTGSMGMIADNLIRKGIATVFEEILERSKDSSSKMISDPHLMVMGIGDVDSDRAPVQATQFEADGVTLATQLEKVYLEHGGGGNSHESYDVAYYMAAQRTQIDCFEKRGKKGYLFTIGDEEIPIGLTSDKIYTFFGDESDNLDVKQLLTMAERTYNIFHIIVEEGAHASSHPDRVKDSWRGLLGQRVLPLSNYENLAEVIISAIQVNEGLSIDKVVGSWSGDTSIVVKNAVNDLVGAGASTGVTRF